jgi:SAM-dependent methyltransferase
LEPAVSLAEDRLGVTGPVATTSRGIPFMCPHDRGALLRTAAGDALVCRACARRFPLLRGIPILINDDQSVFQVADYVQGRSYGGANYGNEGDAATGLRHLYRRTAVAIAGKWWWRGMTTAEAVAIIRAERPEAKILVIGNGNDSYDGDVTYTDVAFGINLDCICDAHDVPFDAESFDAVLAPCVLEHVADPQRCVAEIQRVLKPQGLVFAVTPFLEPVHMGAYDFTRFTPLGHRRLFRHFDEVRAGASLGPSAPVVWTVQTLLLSFSDNHNYRRIVRAATLLLLFPLRLLDLLARDSKTCFDSAGGGYFLGRKRAMPIRDRDMIALYRGAQ